MARLTHFGLRGPGCTYPTRSPRPRGRGQVLAHLRQELTRAVRLGNVGVATRGTGPVRIPAQRIGGDGDDGDSPERGIRLDSASNLVAVEHRELDVHENEVRPALRRRRKPRFTVRGFNDLEIGAREQIP